MKFDMKHVMYAVVIAIVYLVLAFILKMFGAFGMTLITILGFLLTFGAIIYTLREVKNCMEGLMTGLVYVVVWAIFALIFGLINWGAAPLFVALSFKTMFTYMSIWVIPVIQFLLLAMVIGFVNKQK